MKKNYYLAFIYILFSNFIAAQNVDELKIQDGFNIAVFANDLDSPRQMAEGKNGTIFVGERSGQIVALIDSDNNGQADSRILLANDLAYSTGVSIYDGDLYFSEIDKIWKIENIEDLISSKSSFKEKLPEKTLVLDGLPNDTWHGWKWLQHDSAGSLYFNVGAPCNICLCENSQYASILRIIDNRVENVAKGVRNSVGFAFHPENKKLFFTDNGRDWMGDDMPSCELNRLDANGQFFGYPFKHARDIKDPEFGEMNPGYDFIDPIFELGAHVAPTGVAFYEGAMFPGNMKNNLFITLHGSWNSSKKVGYKVLRIVLDDVGNVVSSHDFITGFLRAGKVIGRPSAPLFLEDGSLLISDDKANLIYRVSYNQ